MKQINKFDEFYRSLEGISTTNTNLDERRKSLQQLIQNFDKNIQNKTADKQLLAQNEELGKLLNTSIGKLKNSSTIWVENFEKLLKKEKFRSDLENYFIVIIFGKVKAGKSSLGNFIAKNNTTDNKAGFFKYDEAGSSEDISQLEEIVEDSEDGFATNNLECTMSIQGFRLSGLAWIDTPGLGSMVGQNGELAKEYIQSADYVIYPTSSNSPLQHDEIVQLKELFAQNKKVSICITKSDTFERRRDDSGNLIKNKVGNPAKFLINKTEKNRKDQEKYVNDEIEKIVDKDIESVLGDIFSISAHTAKQGIETNDEQLFENSNMPKFYELLTKVIKEKSQTLKQSTPFNGLLSFIDNELLSNNDKATSVAALEASLDFFDAKLKEIDDKFDMLKQNIDSDISSQAEYVISKYQSEITKQNSTQVFEKIDDELNTTIGDIIAENLKEIMQTFSASLDSIQGSLNNIDEFKIADEYKNIQVSYDDTGFLRNIGNKLGFMDRKYETMTETVKVGDNKNEMVLNFKASRIELQKSNAIANYDSLIKNFFEPMKTTSREIKDEIKKLKNDMNHFKTNLKG